jgi:heme O synthase-like polyprenyltransferase
MNISILLPAPLAPFFLWVVFGIAIVGFSSVSAILVYHWHAFGVNKKKMKQVTRIYFMVSATLLTLLFIGAIAGSF